MRRTRGFTLLELLIALSIFAAIGVMAYSGLSNVLRQQAQTRIYSDRLQMVQMTYRIVQRDLQQFVGRSIRNEFGAVSPALVAGGAFAGVEFTRGGYPNPAGFLRSNLQRVAYVMDEDRLVRRSWRVLDRAQDSLPDQQVLIDKGVQGFNLRYLDDKNTWQQRWPPAGTAPGPTGSLVAPKWPLAVEVRLSLEDLGELKWVFRLPDTALPSLPHVIPPRRTIGG